MDTMSTAEIYDIMMAIKEDPEQGRRHLQTNPSLAYAILQAQVILGFIPSDKAPQYFVGFEASQSNAMAVDHPQAAPSQPQPHSAPPASYGHPSGGAPPQQAPYGYPGPQQPPMQPPQQPPMQPPPAQPAAMPSLAQLVRMPPPTVAQLNLPDQFKTLINIVHTWSSRSKAEFDSLRPEQMAQIRRIFEEAQVPLPR